MLKVASVMLLMMLVNQKHFTPVMCTLTACFASMNQFSETAKISYTLMGDILSFWVTLMSLWIITLVSTMKVNQQELYTKLNCLTMAVLTMAFHTWNLFMFFIAFEMLMVMIVIIVMSWGYQPERVEASMYMILMTMMFSLPFLVMLLNNSNNLNFWFMKLTLKLWDYLSAMFIFMVKMPTYFIHLWLPKIHVEAPIHGSMILAALMLKLGCYGMLRISMITTKLNVKNQSLILAFSLWGALILSAVCNIQSDLKCLIAYSSIVHMTSTFMNITLAKLKSVSASVIIMLGHGLCSSALFFLCNNLYKHSKSRSLLLNKGAMSISPVMLTLWFMLCMSNAPMPPSINVMGELLSIKSVTSWSQSTLVLLFLLMFASSCYSIILFCVTTHGKSAYKPSTQMNFYSSTLVMSIMHIIPLLALTMKASFISIN